MAISAFRTSLYNDKPYNIYFCTSVPNSGTFGVGDWAINTAPAAGGAVLWVCTVASSNGDGGTWKAVSCAS